MASVEINLSSLPYIHSHDLPPSLNALSSSSASFYSHPPEPTSMAPSSAASVGKGDPTRCPHCNVILVPDDEEAGVNAEGGGWWTSVQSAKSSQSSTALSRAVDILSSKLTAALAAQAHLSAGLKITNSNLALALAAADAAEHSLSLLRPRLPLASSSHHRSNPSSPYSSSCPQPPPPQQQPDQALAIALEEKKALENELETLSQALFEEANRMVAEERRERARAEGEVERLRVELEEVRRKRDRDREAGGVVGLGLVLPIGGRDRSATVGEGSGSGGAGKRWFAFGRRKNAGESVGGSGKEGTGADSPNLGTSFAGTFSIMEQEIVPSSCPPPIVPKEAGKIAADPPLPATPASPVPEPVEKDPLASAGETLAIPAVSISASPLKTHMTMMSPLPSPAPYPMLKSEEAEGTQSLAARVASGEKRQEEWLGLGLGLGAPLIPSPVGASITPTAVPLPPSSASSPSSLMKADLPLKPASCAVSSAASTPALGSTTRPLSHRSSSCTLHSRASSTMSGSGSGSSTSVGSVGEVSDSSASSSSENSSFDGSFGNMRSSEVGRGMQLGSGRSGGVGEGDVDTPNSPVYAVGDPVGALTAGTPSLDVKAEPRLHKGTDTSVREPQSEPKEAKDRQSRKAKRPAPLDLSKLNHLDFVSVGVNLNFGSHLHGYSSRASLSDTNSSDPCEGRREEQIRSEKARNRGACIISPPTSASLTSEGSASASRTLPQALAAAVPALRVRATQPQPKPGYPVDTAPATSGGRGELKNPLAMDLDELMRNIVSCAEGLEDDEEVCRSAGLGVECGLAK